MTLSNPCCKVFDSSPETTYIGPNIGSLQGWRIIRSSRGWCLDKASLQTSSSKSCKYFVYSSYLSSSSGIPLLTLTCCPDGLLWMSAEATLLWSCTLDLGFESRTVLKSLISFVTEQDQVGRATGVAKWGEAGDSEWSAPPTSVEISGEGFCIAGGLSSAEMLVMVPYAGFTIKETVEPLIDLRISQTLRWAMPS